MVTKHTPGPWRADWFVAGEGRYIRADARHWSVAQVYALSGCTNPAADISEEERDANAALIAAAPLMLAALEDIFSMTGPIGATRGVWLKSRAAIAKARGE